MEDLWGIYSKHNSSLTTETVIMSERRIDGQGSTAGNVRRRQESTRGTTKSRNQDMLRDIVVVPPMSICGRFGLRAARM